MSEESDRLRLGGMALANGLLVHGPTSWAAAVVDAALDRLLALAAWPRGYDGSHAAQVTIKRLTSELIGRVCTAACWSACRSPAGSSAWWSR